MRRHAHQGVQGLRGPVQMLGPLQIFPQLGPATPNQVCLHLRACAAHGPQCLGASLPFVHVRYAVQTSHPPGTSLAFPRCRRRWGSHLCVLTVLG